MLPEIYLKKSFYEVENKAKQHYRLLNTLKLIDHNSYLYYFCKKYFSPEEQFGSALCPLCRNLFFNDYIEFFDQNQFNPCKLGFYFSQLFDLSQMFQWKIEKNLVFPTIENLKKIRDHQTKDIRKERRKLRDIDTSTRNLKLLVEKQIGIKKPMSKKNKETLKKT